MLFLDTSCAELLTGAEGGWDADLRVCGLPLEATRRAVLPSTHGPVEHLHVQCPRGHRYMHVVERTRTRIGPSPDRPVRLWAGGR